MKFYNKLEIKLERKLDITLSPNVIRLKDHIFSTNLLQSYHVIGQLDKLIFVLYNSGVIVFVISNHSLNCTQSYYCYLFGQIDFSW